ncbi:MAG: phenylalanine 4-monooxygenase, partial [Pseudomonadota bacterium]
HDLFGHVPLLTNPAYAEFTEASGKARKRAIDYGCLQNLITLYWFTIEFGLVRSGDGLKLFGAGMMSSAAEARFALESDSPNRIAFDLERAMCTKALIDDFQQTYFVIDSFDALLDACSQDFGPIYERLAGKELYEPHEIVEGDAVIHQGTREYFLAKQQAAE